jgi:hypothetical protein
MRLDPVVGADLSANNIGLLASNGISKRTSGMISDLTDDRLNHENKCFTPRLTMSSRSVVAR